MTLLFHDPIQSHKQMQTVEWKLFKLQNAANKSM